MDILLLWSKDSSKGQMDLEEDLIVSIDNEQGEKQWQFEDGLF